MSEWWHGIAPTEATIECGGRRHRLRWEAGVLAALDHGDAESERTLAALGGERCECIDVLDAWARHREDPDVFALAARGPDDVLPGQQERGWSRRGVGGFAVAVHPRGAMPGAAATVDPEDDLAALVTLGAGLPTRLVGMVAAAWRDRPLDARHEAALYGRALAALRSWLERPDARIEVEMVDGRASLGIVNRAVRAQLPFSWLIDVWAKGLATVAGRFCLDAQSEDGRRWSLTTVGPDFGRPAEIALEL